ncbi:hypothetical protein ACFPOC_18815, partial [Rubellimicrobium aerolatum]
MNLGAGLGVAVREFRTEAGPSDYALFVGRQLCGIVEAKPSGTTLSAFSEQAARYMTSAPRAVVRRPSQVRFEYVSSGAETLFRDHGDPEPTSRRVFSFHRPETLERWSREPATLRSRLRALPPFIPDHLRSCQIEAVMACLPKSDPSAMSAELTMRMHAEEETQPRGDRHQAAPSGRDDV